MTKPFSSLSLRPELVETTKELGFQYMTEIQEKSIPPLLAGQDLIGQSKTGSGKTTAFTLPILQKIAIERLDLQRSIRLHALVLCPTRELCDQVAREMRKLARKLIGLQILPASGGQPVGPQAWALEKGVHIVVGTPGRVLDHLHRGTLVLDSIDTLVLDEADRMLEMGFEEEMSQVLAACPTKRQTVLFSATFPDQIEQLSSRIQNKAVRITIEDEPLPLTIDQSFLEVKNEFTPRLRALLWVLKNEAPTSSIVFCNFKASVKELAHALGDLGVSAAGLHGDLEQPERDSTLAKFKNGSTRVLIATDVAARGIDVSDLSLVVNFEIPKQTEIYIHRIGRTGRAGKSGRAITFGFPEEKSKIAVLEKITGRSIADVKPGIDLDTASLELLKKDLGQESVMETLFISGGRKNKVRPGDILGALTGEAGGLKGEDIGKIETHDFFTYVAVKRNVSRLALERLRNGRIKGLRFRIEIAK